VQTLLYADAAQRAGTFQPSALGAELEGLEFDGLGNGPTLYRAADHQCFKDVLVVRGKANPETQYDLLEVFQVTPREEITYDPELLGGELGPFNDGA